MIERVKIKNLFAIAAKRTVIRGIVIVNVIVATAREIGIGKESGIVIAIGSVEGEAMIGTEIVAPVHAVVILEVIQNGVGHVVMTMITVGNVVHIAVLIDVIATAFVTVAVVHEAAVLRIVDMNVTAENENVVKATLLILISVMVAIIAWKQSRRNPVKGVLI